MVPDRMQSPLETTVSRRTALRLTGGVAAAGLAGCLGTADSEEFDHTDWPTLGHNAGNTGYTQAQGPGDPDELWSVDTAPISTSPVVADGVVYAGASEGTVYALDLETGEELWTYDVDANLYYTPTVDDDTVYVAADDDTIRAITTDGDEEWTVDVDGSVGSACTVSDGRIHVSTSWYSSILTLDADSGERLWRESGSGLSSTPAVVDGTVYSAGTIVEFDEGDEGDEPEDSYRGIVALDAETGERRWQYDEWDEGGVLNSPAAGDDRLYVGTGDPGAPILALDRSSGERVWRAEVPDFETPYVTHAPVVDDDTVYAGITQALDSNQLHRVPDDQPPSGVVALEAATGEPLWQRGTDGLRPTVAMGADTLYRHTFGELAALEADSGEPSWTDESAFGLPWEVLDGMEYANLTAGTQSAVVEGTVIATTIAGGVYAVGEE